MKISYSKLCSFLLTFALCMLACSGSLFYLLPGYVSLIIMIILLLINIVPIVLEQYVHINKNHLLIFILMTSFIIHNNRNLFSRDIIFISIIILMQLLIWTSKYQGDTWINNTLWICKYFYIFYALYTILEKFIPLLFYISISLFPSKAEVLFAQYSEGCMPGLTNHYSTNGLLLGTGIIIFGAKLINKTSFKNILNFSIMLIAILLTGKRAHILFTLFALYLAYYCYMSNNKSKRIIRSIAIFIFVLLGLFILINYVPSLATFISRFEQSAESGDVTLGRTKMWAIAIECFKTHPLLGIGWGQYISVNPYHWNAHNIYIQLICETGIIGIAIYLYFFISILIKSWKHLKWVRTNNYAEKAEQINMVYSIAMQIFFLMYGITGNPLYDKEAYVPYYMACAIAMYYINRKRFHNTEEKSK